MHKGRSRNSVAQRHVAPMTDGLARAIRQAGCGSLDEAEKADQAAPETSAVRLGGTREPRDWQK
jgi:hypothetical protein